LSLSTRTRSSRVARRTVTIAACNVCGRSILPSEGGVEVCEVSVQIESETRKGDLCVDHIGPIQEAAEVLDPVVPKRARRTFEDSIVKDPSQIPIADGNGP
jgi:hypothetical protein